MTNTQIVCVFSIDNAYCQHLAVAITSLLANSPGCRFQAHIIHHDVQPAALRTLGDYLSSLPDIQHRFHAFDPSQYGFSVSRHITVASYFRFFLTDILPPDLDKVLYLDSDLVVLDTVRPLWETSMGDIAVGAVADPSANKPGFLKIFGQMATTINEQLGLPTDHAYFNAGVLLVNLAAWRAKDVKARLLQFTDENVAVMLYHDQDALNGVLHNDVLYLDYRWNFQAKTSRADATLLGMTDAEFDAARASPGIVHFVGGDKPWKYRRKLPFERIYWRYLRNTPWRGYVQPDRNFKGFLGRHLSPARDYYRSLLRRSKPVRVSA